MEDSLQAQLNSVITAMGYELVGCELLKQGHQSLLRIYIDCEKGITLDDCARVSHQVSALLDVEDPIPGKYTLEVSSPGVNRPLFELNHFQKYKDSNVKLRTKYPVDGRRRFVGVLLEVKDSNIHMLVEGQEIVLPFSSIEKANVMSDINIRQK